MPRRVRRRPVIASENILIHWAMPPGAHGVSGAWGLRAEAEPNVPNTATTLPATSSSL